MSNNCRLVGAVLTLVLVVVLAVPPAVAQGLPARVRVAAVDRETFPNVDVTVQALNTTGVPIRGLTAANFEVLENGHSVPLTSLQEVATSTANVAVVVGLDTSGSMAGAPLRDAQAAIDSFLRRLGPSDEAGAVTFGAAGCGVPGGFGPTTEKGAVIDFIRGAQAVGSTPFYEGALAAIRMSLAAPQGRRMVVLLTDGDDSCSKVSFDTVVAQAGNQGIPLFIVGLGPGLRAAELQRLALVTGGQYFAAADASQLGAIYADLSRLLRTQYVLRYASQGLADHQERQLTVRVTAGGGEVAGEGRYTPPALLPKPRLLIDPGTTLDGSTRIAVANDAPVPLARAEYYLDGDEARAPYFSAAGSDLDSLALTVDAKTLLPGTHNLRVKLVDPFGGEAMSAPVELVVPEPPAVPTSGSSTWLLLGATLLLAGLAVVAVSVFGRRRRATYAACGHLVEPGWSTCPYCEPTSATDGSRAGSTSSGFTRPSASGADGGGVRRRTERLDLTSPPGAWLVVTAGPQLGQRFLLQEETTIGGAGGNDIVLDDRAVSGQHARVRRQGSDFYLADLDSSNGTLVNSRPITREKLTHGDEITMGHSTLAFLQVNDARAPVTSR